MEKSCYKCGHTMEEGRPFCPHCGAPQIRVLIAEPAGSTISTAEAAAIPQMSASLPASQTVPVLAVPMQWSQALKPCTLAAGVASLLMLLGLNPFVGMVSVGFLAVVFYRQVRPQASIRPGTGARLGALSGLICFAMASIVEAMLVLVLHKGPEIRQALLAAINQAAARTSEAQALAMFEHFRSPEGLEFLMVFGLLFGLVAAIVLSALSGALGGAVLGPRRKP
jgi:RNA polymerase subunit RPABC4/transcription elongation factor Spt4